MLKLTPLIIAAFFANHAFSSTLLVVNKSSGSISLLSEQSLKQIKEIQLGSALNESPHEVAVNPSGKMALVSHYGKVKLNLRTFSYNNKRNPGSKLSLIDVQAAKITKVIELPKSSAPHGIQFLSESEAVVTADGIQSILFVNIDTGKVLGSYPVPGAGVHMLAVDRAQNFLYGANADSGSVFKFDLKTHLTVAHQVIGQHAEGIALSEDEQTVLVTNRKDHQLAILKSENLEIQNKIQTQRGPIRVALFDNGKAAVVINTLAGSVQTYDLTKSAFTHAFPSTEWFSVGLGKNIGGFYGKLKVPVTILVRADQKTAYVANSFAGNITLVDLMNGQILETFTAGKEPDGLAVSPLDVL